MHPEIMRDLVVQHDRELRDQAHRAILARAAGRARRARRDVRRGTESPAHDFVVPAIPDYVDGSFRTAAEEAADRVPTARHVA